MRRRRVSMSTNSFERKTIIRDRDSKEKPTKLLEFTESAKNLMKLIYSDEERKQTEKRLTQFLFRNEVVSKRAICDFNSRRFPQENM